MKLVIIHHQLGLACNVRHFEGGSWQRDMKYRKRDAVEMFIPATPALKMKLLIKQSEYAFINLSTISSFALLLFENE